MPYHYYRDGPECAANTAFISLLELTSGGSAIVEIDVDLTCEIATPAPIRSVWRVPFNMYPPRPRRLKHNVGIAMEKITTSTRVVHVTRVGPGLIPDPISGGAFPTRVVERDDYLYECARRFNQDRSARSAAYRVDEDAPYLGGGSGGNSRDYRARFPRMCGGGAPPPPPATPTPASASSASASTQDGRRRRYHHGYSKYRQKDKAYRPASAYWRPDYDDENGGPEPWWPTQERYTHAMFVALRRMTDSGRSPGESAWENMDRHCVDDVYTREEFELMLGHYWKGREPKLIWSGWGFFLPFKPSAKITYED